MTRPVIVANGKVDVFVDVEWLRQPLGEDVDHEASEEDESGIRTARLVEAVSGTSRSFVDPHQADVRAAPQSVLSTRNREVGPRVWLRGSSIDVHYPEFKLAERASHLCP